MIVDPANLPNMDSGSVFQELPTTVLNYEFKANINRYFESLGPNAPVKSLAELIRFNDAHRDREMPFFGQERLIISEATTSLDAPEYRKAVETIQRLTRAEGIDAVMNQHRLDALVAPTAGPAWLTDHIRGDRFDGGDSAGTAAIAGYPDITVPMGLVSGLPVGISFFGRAWSEPTLLKVAYAYEQATQTSAAADSSSHAGLSATVQTGSTRTARARRPATGNAKGYDSRLKTQHSSPDRSGPQPSAHQRLVERVPVVGGGHSRFDLVDERAAAIAVRHDGDAVPLAQVPDDVGLEAPVGAAVREVPALVALVDRKAHAVRAHADRRGHLLRGGLRQHRARRDHARPSAPR